MLIIILIIAIIIFANDSTAMKFLAIASIMAILHTRVSKLSKNKYCSKDREIPLNNTCKVECSMKPTTVEQTVNPEINDYYYLNKAYQTQEQVCGDVFSDRMAIMGRRAQESMINRAKLNANTFKEYYTEELESNENKVWWEQDHDII